MGELGFSYRPYYKYVVVSGPRREEIFHRKKLNHVRNLQMPMILLLDWRVDMIHSLVLLVHNFLVAKNKELQLQERLYEIQACYFLMKPLLL